VGNDVYASPRWLILRYIHAKFSGPLSSRSRFTPASLRMTRDFTAHKYLCNQIRQETRKNLLTMIFYDDIVRHTVLYRFLYCSPGQ